jgi:hypothetical protein
MNSSAAPAHRVAGRLRRLVHLERIGPQRIQAWVEDDFHHFGVTVDHDGECVRSIAMQAVRHPWSTCPGAAEPLQALVGKPLIERASDIGDLIDMRLQCTHVFDLTGLALAHAALGRGVRDYEAIIEDRERLRSPPRGLRDFGRGRAVLLRDGIEVLGWEIEGDCIRESGGERSLNEGFRAWTEMQPLESAEQAGVLRRAILVAAGRGFDFTGIANAAAMRMPAQCHSFQPIRSVQALYLPDSRRNYEHGAEGMLAQVAGTPRRVTVTDANPTD